MLRFYKSENGVISPAAKVEPHTWVALFNPSEEEMSYVERKCHVLPEFLRYPLDEEERPRIEKEEHQVFVLLRVPEPVSKGMLVKYETLPIGIVITEEHIITVCLKEHPIFEEFVSFANKAKDFDLANPVRFLLSLMLTISNAYIKLLRQIDRVLDEYEEEIFKSIENEEIVKMLGIEKTLTYFNTSLQGNETVCVRLKSGRYLRLSEDEEELLEDVQVEVRQAIEMTRIFLDIVSNTMDAYASIISNNLNIIMKFLASMAIILSIPNIIYGMYGMNIPLPMVHLPPLKGTPYTFYILNFFTLILLVVCFFFFRKKKYL